MRPHTFEPLLYVISNGGIATLSEIGQAFATRERVKTAVDYGRELVRSLVESGALNKRETGVYSATEKGRIAAALFMAKNPDMRVVYFDGIDLA